MKYLSKASPALTPLWGSGERDQPQIGSHGPGFDDDPCDREIFLVFQMCVIDTINTRISHMLIRTERGVCEVS